MWIRTVAWRSSAMSCAASCLPSRLVSSTNFFGRTWTSALSTFETGCFDGGNQPPVGSLKKSRGIPKGSRLWRTPLAWAGKDSPKTSPSPRAGGGGTTPPTNDRLRRQKPYSFFLQQDMADKRPCHPHHLFTKTWPTSGRAVSRLVNLCRCSCPAPEALRRTWTLFRPPKNNPAHLSCYKPPEFLTPPPLEDMADERPWHLLFSTGRRGRLSCRVRRAHHLSIWCARRTLQNEDMADKRPWHPHHLFTKTWPRNGHGGRPLNNL